MEKLSVIITAGGVGKRMGSDIPKQFLLLENKPILQHCIEAFYNYKPSIQILVTLPNSFLEYWKEICTTTNFKIPHEIVDGGMERYHSIKNALDFVTGEYLAIHDGVRPLVSKEILENSFKTVKIHKAVIPVIALKDSIRKINKEESLAKNRNDFVLVQTPQVFEFSVIKKAYQQDFHEGITDDASLVEQLGQKISLITGSEENIKITSPIDLKIAAVFLQERENK